MIELFFVVCLKTMPAACEERSLLSVENDGLMSCMMQAQPQLAEWCESHPNLQVKRWSCRNASEREIRA
jgi:hypothetical protein